MRCEATKQNWADALKTTFGFRVASERGPWAEVDMAANCSMSDKSAMQQGL